MARLDARVLISAAYRLITARAVRKNLCGNAKTLIRKEATTLPSPGAGSRLPLWESTPGAHFRGAAVILDRQRDYIGGIIVASEVHRLRDDLTTFCRESRLPVVFTDLEPFENESEYPDNSAFIGYDSGELGELAGEWLVKQLRGKKRPRVLIIASREHSSRQERCAKVLRAELPGALITIDDQCDFMRSRAYDAVNAHARRLGSRECLDAIFCTNDEMALGAVDALSALASASASAPSPMTNVTKATVVVGVDGVHEARVLIDTGSSPLRATVTQDTHRLAVSVVDLLAKMYRGHAVPRRTILSAEIYEASSAS